MPSHRLESDRAETENQVADSSPGAISRRSCRENHLGSIAQCRQKVGVQQGAALIVLQVPMTISYVSKLIYSRVTSQGVLGLMQVTSVKIRLIFCSDYTM